MLILLIFCYVSRGVIRKSVLPSTTSFFYSNNLNKTLVQERKMLDAIYPFGQAKYIDETLAKCDLSYAHNLKTEVWCGNYLFRKQVSIKDVATEDFKVKAQTFEQSLKKQGWVLRMDASQIPSSEHSFGWWYSIQYDKKTNGNTCRLSVERDDNPELLNSYLGCDRSVVYF